MKNPKYTIKLSDKDKLFVSFKTEKGKIIDFILQYHGLTDKGWRTIIRYDTQHGFAHEHRCYFNNKEKNRRIYLGRKEDYSLIYTGAYKKLIKDYKKIRENYLLRK